MTTLIDALAQRINTSMEEQNQKDLRTLSERIAETERLLDALRAEQRDLQERIRQDAAFAKRLIEDETNDLPVYADVE